MSAVKGPLRRLVWKNGATLGNLPHTWSWKTVDKGVSQT